MVDVVDRETRSRMMACIRTKNTRPEMIVRRSMFAAGLRYRLHRRDLPGNPDIVMPGRKVAIFVHGCFWHQHAECRLAKMPTTNREFWLMKLNTNLARDQSAVEALVVLGWRVLTIWECDTRGRDSIESIGGRISDWLDGDCQVGEL